MPSSVKKTLKDLHLASSVGDLNKLADAGLPVDKNPNPATYIKSADKIYLKAERHDLEGDEENAYVFYMHFFNIICLLKKSNKYTKKKKYYDDLMGKTKALRSIDRAEALQKSLDERYEKLEIQKQAKAKGEEETKRKEEDKKALMSKKAQNHEVDRSTGLSPGWERIENGGRPYYKDHNTQTTHWELPKVPTTGTTVAAPQSSVPKQQQPQIKRQSSADRPSLCGSLSSPNLARLSDEGSPGPKKPVIVHLNGVGNSSSLDVCQKLKVSHGAILMPKTSENTDEKHFQEPTTTNWETRTRKWQEQKGKLHEELTGVAQQLTDGQEQLQQQKELRETRLCEQLKEKDNQKQNLERHLREMEEQLRGKDEEQQSLQRQLREMEQQLVNCQGQFQEQLREKELQEENSQRQLREMEHQLRGKDEEQQNLQRQLREMEQQLRGKDEEQQNLQRQLREMEQQLRGNDEEQQNLQRQLREMEQQLRGKDEEQQNLQRQLREMEQQLRGKDEEQQNLQRQLREMEQQLGGNDEEQQNLQRQLREMEQQLVNCQGQFQEQLREKELQEENSQRQLREMEEQLREKEQGVNELELSLTLAQETITDQRRQETCDWVVSRNEIQVTDKCLGRGGWGSVYEGKYCGCPIAVKQIHELILSPHNRRLFEREMNIASTCRHPCLLQFVGATNDDGSPLFLTELMETSLRALLEQRQLSETEISVISLDVARALNYLHQKRPSPIIHRDVSSANVLLWRQGDQWRAKVSDYGAANFMQQTMTVGLGAVIYCAPEAFTSNQTVKVDVYSFGVLIGEMCIRELPDPGKRDEQVVLVTNRVLRGLVRRCLQTDPEMRPNMQQIIDELEQFSVECRK